MTPRGSALLILTFVTGTGAGVLLSRAKDSEALSSRKTEESSSGLRLGPHEDRPRPLPTGRESAEPTAEEALDDESEDESHGETLGRPFAEVLKELEDAYQEQARLLREEEQETEPTVEEPSPASEQVLESGSRDERAELTDNVNDGGEAFDEPETADENEAEDRLLLASRGSNNEGSVTEIQNGDRYSEQNIQQTVVVQNVSPIVYMNFGAGSVPREEPTVQATSPMVSTSSTPWASSSTSGTNPWAPIDYSGHHNPFSAMSGRSQTLPPTGGSGLTVVYRR